MDRSKRPNSSFSSKNSKMYMDFEDIIRENTLPFLPAKCLGRCRSVCREWKLQISTPFFAHNQANSFRDTSGFFVQISSGLPSFLSLDPMAYGVPDPLLKFLPEPVDIICSSNGLLCVRGHTGYKAYYICNPATKQWKKLPKPIADHGSDPAVVLIFEPSLLNFVADYKLICAFPSELDGYEFEIYSSAENSWRISGEIFYGSLKIEPRSGVHVGGVVYWIADTLKIVAFDIKSERSSVIVYPPSGILGVVNGKLCCVNVQGQGLLINELNNPYANTMARQMHEKTKYWGQKRIRLENSLPSGVVLTNGKVLYVGGDVAVFWSESKLFSYNLKTKAFTELLFGYSRKVTMVPYVNNLVEI